MHQNEPWFIASVPAYGRVLSEVQANCVATKWARYSQRSRVNYAMLVGCWEAHFINFGIYLLNDFDHE